MRHHPIDLNSSLASQLSGKHLVEYPTFLVLLGDEAKGYPLVGKSPISGTPLKLCLKTDWVIIFLEQ